MKAGVDFGGVLQNAMRPLTNQFKTCKFRCHARSPKPVNPNNMTCTPGSEALSRTGTVTASSSWASVVLVLGRPLRVQQLGSQGFAYKRF